MSNPLRHIDDATRTIAARKTQRDATQLQHRGALAAELIADELTMIRAEMGVIREQLGIISGHVGILKK
jgi:hypothetical protein